ncbi:MAG: biotin synthase BioB [Pirellulaceae bacterium]
MPQGKNDLRALRECADEGKPISAELAQAVLQSEAGDLPDILAAANAMRRRFFGEAVHLCSIVNAKCGLCGEDCAFCAQASDHNTGVTSFPLLGKDQIVDAYRSASDLPVGHFGVVASGKRLSRENLDRVCQAVRENREEGPHWCGSLGCLRQDQLVALKNAGLKRFHHNLETAESFFPKICTTHTYADRLATVSAVKEVGLELCCGGILGLGESLEQRVEFALALARVQADVIPLNFLIPIKGTQLADRQPMKPIDILRTVAVFRMLHPRAEIKVCAGRTLLRDLQSMIFFAGATGMMIGPLLTVAGRDVDDDLQMLRDLEVVLAD